MKSFLAALVLLNELLLPSASFAERKTKDEFRQEMMPKLGKQVTVRGRLAVGKGYDGIAVDGGGWVALWPLYVGSEDSPDFRYRYGERLAVSGVLHYYEGAKAPPGAGNAPPAFYILWREAQIRKLTVRKF